MGLLANDKVAEAAGLKLASVFSSHMVLQSDSLVPVWGWAGEGEKVDIAFGGQTKSAVADGSGKWMVKLDTMAASTQPRELIASAGTQTVKLDDVLVGEVWLASGQSNMALPVSECKNAQQEIAAADHPLLRLLNVHGQPSLKPMDSFVGEWAQCSPKSVGAFSGAGYYFGRELQSSLNVPVGIINSSWGGTPAESWTRLEALKTIPRLGTRAEAEIALMQAKPADDKRYAVDLASWQAKNGVGPAPMSESAASWADPALPTSDWKTVTLPGTWEHAGFNSGGVFWIRRDINIPAAVAQDSFIIWLKRMDENYNTIYWNGVEVGKGAFRYVIPPKLVTPGRNVLAIRLVSESQKTVGNDIAAPVPGEDAPENKWLAKQEVAFPPLTDEAVAARPKPNAADMLSVSSAMYNGLINPLIPFRFRGAIWYQGESNVGRPLEYRELLSLLITDWRSQWGEGDFPFIIQQLPNIKGASDDPNQAGSFPAIREAQLQVAETIPDCGLSVGIDLGEGAAIHPKNKQDIGKRLALVALQQTYHKAIEAYGPRYQSMKIEGDTIRLTFTHADGLHGRNGDLKRFAIAGADRKFVWAAAKADGETVVVSSPQVSQPIAVRYAWSQNPEGCNLVNSADMLASPFRTDAW